jgi:hypothetical protein
VGLGGCEGGGEGLVSVENGWYSDVSEYMCERFNKDVHTVSEYLISLA